MSWDEEMKEENKGRNHFHYKGLTFAKYHGNLSREEQRSGKVYYAFYGGKPMTTEAIRYQVGEMIRRRQWPAMKIEGYAAA